MLNYETVQCMHSAYAGSSALTNMVTALDHGPAFEGVTENE